MPVPVDLRDLAFHAQVIVEATVSDPAHVEVKRVGAAGCPEHAVGVYRLDVLEVRKAPPGVDVPKQIDALDPVDLRAAQIADGVCTGTPGTPPEIGTYSPKIPWGPGKEVVVLLSWTDDAWVLASAGSWDAINKADKVARMAGVRE